MIATRGYRAVETYEFQCSQCKRMVELAVSRVKDGWGRCPKCDARVQIEWRAEAS